MKDEDLEIWAKQVSEAEKKRINDLDWLDLTYEKLSLIDDKTKSKKGTK